MKAFVTGSTGLLGYNLVNLLVEEGHSVKILARSRDKALRLFGDSKVEVITGDMAEVSAWADQLSGCDVLFHTAAYFRDYYQPGNHWPTLEAINITATMTLLEEAEQRGVGKVVYVSSSGVIGPKSNGQSADETTGPGTLSYSNLYYKSKVLAEARIESWLKNHRLPVILILPGAIVGPGDSGPTSVGQLVLDFMAKKLPGVLEGGFSLVDARDVAGAMLKAVEQGRSGERYIIGGVYASFGDTLKTLEGVSGVAAPKIKIPPTLSLAMAWTLENFARLTGSKTLVTLDAVRIILSKARLNSAKAQRELNTTFRPLEESLRDSVNWYRQHSYIPTAASRLEEPALR